MTALGRALAALGDRYELMAVFAACTGLRWGELAALTTAQVDPAARTVTVDRKVIEMGGTLHTEPPKGRKQRRTIYPRLALAGYPLAEKIAARLDDARAEHDAGNNPAGLMFPSPRGTHWRSSNFARRVLAPAYRAAGWHPAPAGHPAWTWRSLRHVFCTTALFTWHMDPADVSRLVGTPASGSPLPAALVGRWCLSMKQNSNMFSSVAARTDVAGLPWLAGDAHPRERRLTSPRTPR